MSLPSVLQRLRIPVIAAPMFIAGNPKLVIEQCKAGGVAITSARAASAGVGQIDAVMPVAQVVENLAREYVTARQRLQIN